MKYQKVFEYYEAEDYYKALGLIEDIRAVYKGTDKYETLKQQSRSYYEQLRKIVDDQGASLTALKKLLG